MKRYNLNWFICGLGAIVFLFSACSKDGDEPAQPDEGKPLSSVLVKNLPADPSTRDLNDGTPIGADHRYTFFRFSDTTVVLYDSVETDRSDSASQKWDIAFRGTSIILNDGKNGPGAVEAQIVNQPLKELNEAPESGYQTGDVFQSWYSYDPQKHVITPKPGYILVIHTNDDKYVKMQIVGYYKDMPEHPSVESNQRYYTFRYVIQQDGSRSFSKE